MNKQTNNYARHLATGTYVFFDDAHAPSFSSPWQWAFFRRPAGVAEEDFRGGLVGHNLAGNDDCPETEKDSGTPAS